MREKAKSNLLRNCLESELGIYKRKKVFRKKNVQNIAIDINKKHVIDHTIDPEKKASLSSYFFL